MSASTTQNTELKRTYASRNPTPKVGEVDPETGDTYRGTAGWEPAKSKNAGLPKEGVKARAATSDELKDDPNDTPMMRASKRAKRAQIQKEAMKK